MLPDSYFVLFFTRIRLAQVPSLAASVVCLVADGFNREMLCRNGLGMRYACLPG
jgi:hypothetical protein